MTVQCLSKLHTLYVCLIIPLNIISFFNKKEKQIKVNLTFGEGMTERKEEAGGNGVTLFLKIITNSTRKK